MGIFAFLNEPKPEDNELDFVRNESFMRHNDAAYREQQNILHPFSLLNTPRPNAIASESNGHERYEQHGEFTRGKQGSSPRISMDNGDGEQHDIIELGFARYDRIDRRHKVTQVGQDRTVDGPGFDLLKTAQPDYEVLHKRIKRRTSTDSSCDPSLSDDDEVQHHPLELDPAGRQGEIASARWASTAETCTIVSAPAEGDYKDFPSRDGTRELRPNDRGDHISIDSEAWCVRDITWLDVPLSRALKDEDYAGTKWYKHLPYPYQSKTAGGLSNALGVAEVWPEYPYWEGAEVPRKRKLDTWFLAGAQHCMRSQSSLSAKFFLRFPETEAFEDCIRAALHLSTIHRFTQRGLNVLNTINRFLGSKLPMELVQTLQNQIESEKHQCLRLCLTISYNLKRYRAWLWRDCNSEIQPFVLGNLLLSKITHETLLKMGYIKNPDDVVGYLDLIEPHEHQIIPPYQRHQIDRSALVEAAWEELVLHPPHLQILSETVHQAFKNNGCEFENWTRAELLEYARPYDGLWRTLDLSFIKLKHCDGLESPYRSRPDVYIKERWIEEMVRSTKALPEDFLKTKKHVAVTPDDKDNLESVWAAVTSKDHRNDNHYTYKIPRHLRRIKSMPNLPKKWRPKIRLGDDQDTSSLGFSLEDLPAQRPLRTNNRQSPGYPKDDKYELCSVKDGYNNHYFIVIGWFPGKRSEPVECSMKDRTHEILNCSASETVILAQFHKACFQQTLRRDSKGSRSWASWVTRELNNWDPDERNEFYFPMPIESHLSLQLLTRWSRYRLVMASTVPMLLSIGIGVYYMEVMNDVQTAWTVGSYIVTAGAFLIAVLAVLTGLRDGDGTLGQAKKHGPDAGMGV